MQTIARQLLRAVGAAGTDVVAAIQVIPIVVRVTTEVSSIAALLLRRIIAIASAGLQATWATY